MTCRHAHEFLRDYGWKFGGYAPALYVARQRLAEEEAKMFQNRRLIRDLKEAVRFLDESCRGQLWTPMTLEGLLENWN